MSPVYFAEHCHYDNEEIAADINCSSHWLLQELEGIGAGWQGLSHLTGGFFAVLAADKEVWMAPGTVSSIPALLSQWPAPVRAGQHWSACKDEVSRSRCRDL